MIDRREILDTANRVSLRPDVVEKDYVLGWILAGISAHEAIANTWIFKGGTCLKKCFFETYRFSEDLDFTLRDETHLDENFLQQTFAEIGDWIYEETGIEVPADRQDFDIFTNPRGTLSCQGKLSYGGPISPRTGGWPRVKLDLTAAERIVLPPVRVPIFHPYTDAPNGGIDILAYDYVEAFAEKFRALAERTRPRDLYDVVNLYRNIESRPDAAMFRDVLREKCAFKGIALPQLVDLTIHRPEVETGWRAMLDHQLPALLPVDSFWDELPAIFDWLHGVPTPVPLAPFPIAGTLIRDRVLQIPGGISNQSFIETIRFAAANRLHIDLQYRDANGSISTRSIAPYSFRRSLADEILLMATREADGEPRSYRIDRIVSVSATQRVFTPRYPIELTPTGPISIPNKFSIPASQARSRTVRRSVSTGPTYIYRCPVCGKEFSRKTHDSALNKHKNKSGWDCYGTYGVYVRTRY